ncbi:MAG: flagellar type III secretion system pore protein FliP [Bacillota bacterium]|nr:flagellar type III secretion system pore protein FliP [Bacillota bacterium]
MKNRLKKGLPFALAALIILPCISFKAYAAGLDINLNGTGTDTLEILETLTFLALLPTILIMTTCFTRIVIVFSFVRNALGLQQTPPNQVLVGLSLILSIFIMTPVLNRINNEAYKPYKAEQITQEEFVRRASDPMKTFMLKQTKKDDLDMFVGLAKIKNADSVRDIPITVVIPAFVTSELKRAFTIGFLIYIPFLVIDLIVSSTLMSMGMMMLPPAMISLPFKLLLFVLADGWGLLIKSLVASFNM